MRLPKLEEGWSTLLILWAMLLVSSSALVQANITDGMEIMPFMATIAIFTGLILAKSKFNDSTAHIFSFLYGIFFVFLMVGLILPGELSWHERVLDIINRQVFWFEKAISGGTSRDGLIFVIQTAIIFWLLGYTAAWYTFRSLKIWRVIMPTGIVLMSVVYYYNGPKPLPLYLAAYALLTLLYIVRTHLAVREKEWRANFVRYEHGIWFDFLRAGTIASAMILFMSWTIPTLSASNTMGDVLGTSRGPWREFQDNWTRMFSSLRSYGSATSDVYQDTLVLGGPRTVGTTPVMDIYVDEIVPYLYWQAVAYDTFQDGGWSIREETQSKLQYPEDGELELADMRARIPLEQTIVNYTPNSSLLYGAPQASQSDRQMFVESIVDEDGKERVSSLRSRYVLRQGEEYQLTSQVSVADAQSLRLSGTDYPQWVTDYYLQLHDTLTPETVALAEELTAEYDNNFDKALSVRNYLRNNITYNDQIEAPPDGVDSIHYTLFESKEGYCNYYATAMVMMLRSQGVPARLVTGFAQGEFNPETSSYRVRASNAHTWVEVYFHGFGWIQFEPTASIPTVDRPQSLGGGDAFPDALAEDNTASPSIPDEGADALTEEERLAELLANDTVADTGGIFFGAGSFPIWPAVGASVVLLLAGFLIWLTGRRNARIESGVSTSYTRLESWSQWLGLGFRPSDTPYERADLMISAVPEGEVPIQELTRQYVHTQFSPDHAPDASFDARAKWKKLRPLLMRESIALRWRRFVARFGRDRS